MTALVLLQFDELVASMAATPVILETDPSAVELMDRMLIDLTRAQPGYASQISLIEGDPAGILAVEFYGESEAELQQKCDRLKSRLVAAACARSPTPWSSSIRRDRRIVWSVRKAGLGLLITFAATSSRSRSSRMSLCRSSTWPNMSARSKKWSPATAPRAAYYAHASAGCLHIRPLINLKDGEGVEMMRRWRMPPPSWRTASAE